MFSDLLRLRDPACNCLSKSNILNIARNLIIEQLVFKGLFYQSVVKLTSNFSIASMIALFL